MNKIIYVGGGKGGVGKSKLSFATLDYLTEKGNVVLIETDTSNPDVYKSHANEEKIICKQCDLDNSDGWIELVNICDEFKEHPVVINSAARNEKGIKKYAETLGETLPELNRELTVFWIINRQKDSLALLKNFMTFFNSVPVYVWRNLYFGNEEKFELYNTSKLKKEVEKIGLSLNFPDLADRVADKIYSDRKSIKTALAELQIGDRAELKRWRNNCFSEFKKVSW